MNNPLEIMDEIERDPMNRGCSTVAATKRQWQALRAALEEQAEREAQKDARIARLEMTLTHITEGAFTIDEACSFARKALNESNEQSLEVMRAAALMSSSNRCRLIPPDHDLYQYRGVISDWLSREADCILEHKPKEASDE